jgi:hypothetical protein
VTGDTPRPYASSRARLLTALLLVAAVLVAACGAAEVTSNPAPSGSAAASQGTGEAKPSATSWPGGVVEAIVTLGKADLEIQAAGADLGAAAAYQDLQAMWGAADGLVTLLTRLTPQVDRIKDYPETAPAAVAYKAAFPDMLAGATELRDAIKAGDAAGITSGSQRLAVGLEAYRLARRVIGPMVDQAILMQRILVK